MRKGKNRLMARRMGPIREVLSEEKMSKRERMMRRGDPVGYGKWWRAPMADDKSTW